MLFSRCAPTADPNSPAAPPAEARWVPLGTWPWRRWPTPSSFPASTPRRAAKSRFPTPRRRSTRSCASSGRTPARVPAPPASGRAPWTPWCLTWCISTSPSPPCRWGALMPLMFGFCMMKASAADAKQQKLHSDRSFYWWIRHFYWT